MSQSQSLVTQKQPSSWQERNMPHDGENARLFETAMKLYDQYQFKEAREIFAPLADLGYHCARFYLARCYYRESDFEQAYKHYYILSTVDPEEKEYYVAMLASIEMIWGNYSHTISLLKTLPPTPNRLFTLALAHWTKYEVFKDRGSRAAAIDILDQIDIQGFGQLGLQRFFHLRAMIYQDAKQFSLSEQFYHKALAFGGNAHDLCGILNDLASLHLSLGQVKEAEQFLYRSRELAGDNEIAQAHSNKWFGVLAILQNRDDEAKMYIDGAIRIFQKREFLGELATIHMLPEYVANLPKPQSTQLSAGKVLSAPPLEIGIQYYSKKEFPKAIEILSPLAYQGNPEARKYLATCYYHMDLFESAREHCFYLAECGVGIFIEFGISMLALMDLIEGNTGNAIKQLSSLPESPRNLINLSLAYYQVYNVRKDEFSIREALRLLKRIKLNLLSTAQQVCVYNLMGLMYQVQHEFHYAKRQYQDAFALAETPAERGTVLNDYASLLIEYGEYEEAEATLTQARGLIGDQHTSILAFNLKWQGILASLQKRYLDASRDLQQAVTVLRDKELLQELASILYILADSTRKENFYQAAEYFADGLSYEGMSEEMSERDDTIIRFYYDGFFCT